jgi:hypothetical protein
MVLLRRGEVQRGCALPNTSLALFPLLAVEAVDDAEREDVEAFDEIDVSGGRVGTGCRVSSRWSCKGAESKGDESVKSKVSQSADEDRSCGGGGIGAALKVGGARRSFVGVTEARHASKVLCFDFPGDESTEVPRGAFVVGASFAFRVFAFFAGSCEGEGRAGESTRSSVSIVSSNGGVADRSKTVLLSAGSVFERCIGARLLLFVTLGGSSSSAGDNDFSSSGWIAGAATWALTSDEHSKSTTSVRGRSAGRGGGKGRSGSWSCAFAFARARDNLKPGLVTFAKLSIRACG